jgi:hypothetical protein
MTLAPQSDRVLADTCLPMINDGGAELMETVVERTRSASHLAREEVH